MNERAFAYHERTKHHLNRYARSLGYLDWKNQPDPFRRYSGVPIEPLERPEPSELPTLDECYSPERIAPQPIDDASLAQLFYHSLALSAWKVAGESRWSLRVNPSSGNLHPTEAYLIRDRVQHYAPYVHALETLGRAEHSNGVMIGLSSIHWREAWKYGERAYRYCQHDAGHAIAAIAFSAAALGWKTRIVEASDREIASLLGIDRQSGVEAEHPDILLQIGPNARAQRLGPFSVELSGTPNHLSTETVRWDAIDDVNLACTMEIPPDPIEHPLPSIAEPPMRSISARRIIRGRRSAVDLDGETSIDAEAFFRMMQRAMPGRVPFSALWWRPAIHLALFVHRVNGVPPGVYLLAREPEAEARLRGAMDPTFEWERPDGCPADLPLFRLGEGDVRRVAGLVCCQQAIAADGAFAVAMLGDLSRLSSDGGWFYRRLHFEAGAIGQVLYLEAEAASGTFRGTGIGCFFDDLISDSLKLRSPDFGAIYCFTAGGALEDTRIQSEPPYVA